MLVQPAVVGVFGEICCETRHRRHRWDLLKHPPHVAPPEAAVAVVMISIRIRKLVVVAVQADPVNGALLAAQGAARGKESLEPLGQAEGAVAEQSVVTDGHAQTGGDPIEDQQGGGGLPAPEHRQKRQGSKDVDGSHKADGSPAAAWAIAGGGPARAGPVQGC